MLKRSQSPPPVPARSGGEGGPARPRRRQWPWGWRLGLPGWCQASGKRVVTYGAEPGPARRAREAAWYHFGLRQRTKTMNVVILAAGQGKRMHSDLPKVLHLLAGRPLLAHVIDTARSLKPGVICIVYGYGGERVREVIARPGLVWARQEPQLGTRHGLGQAPPYLTPST